MWIISNVSTTLGHAEGDRVLHVIGSTLTATMGNDAIISSFGGEEFVVLLPSASAGQASALASRIQVALHTTTDRSGPLKVSIGVAERRAGELLEDVVSRADHAVLNAKASGRVAGPTLIQATLPAREHAIDPGEIIGVAPTDIPTSAPVIMASEQPVVDGSALGSTLAASS